MIKTPEQHLIENACRHVDAMRASKKQSGTVKTFDRLPHVDTAKKLEKAVDIYRGVKL